MLHCECSESSDQVYSHILLLLRACHFVHHSSSYGLIMLPLYLPLAFAVAMVLGPVVQEPISTNPRLNCNLYFFFHLFKSIFGIIFCVLFKASNSYSRQKEIRLNFLQKLSDLKSDFTLPTWPWVYSRKN